MKKSKNFMAEAHFFTFLFVYPESKAISTQSILLHVKETWPVILVAEGLKENA